MQCRNKFSANQFFEIGIVIEKCVDAECTIFEVVNLMHQRFLEVRNRLRRSVRNIYSHVLIVLWLVWSETSEKHTCLSSSAGRGLDECKLSGFPEVQR
ncbi:hypothetical protein DO73_3481 [Burkholderia pseudomallei]|nr:hypothetical protein DO73_3481 [Burkholderia pseudomallei]